MTGFNFPPTNQPPRPFLEAGNFRQAQVIECHNHIRECWGVDVNYFIPNDIWPRLRTDGQPGFHRKAVVGMTCVTVVPPTDWGTTLWQSLRLLATLTRGQWVQAREMMLAVVHERRHGNHFLRDIWELLPFDIQVITDELQRGVTYQQMLARGSVHPLGR